MKCKMLLLILVHICVFAGIFLALFVSFVCVKCQSRPGTHICGAFCFITVPAHLLHCMKKFLWI